jgi:Zn-dependent M16 (insulinase) family peptidase
MTPANSLQPGQVTEGFRVTRVTPLPDLRATAIECVHERTGARLLHVYAPTDTENCFAVTFPTPPPDDTGLPHIMEHAVLGGSRKFPVREPFFEMVKCSMATFINAMTYQAFTVYPIATNVKKDFFNLVEVYLDAVFHPELKEDTFRREGHHFTLADNNDLNSPLQVTGIVFNEMKGAYSSPESLMYELAGRGLFPDTPLGRDSGGDPQHIPNLTYEQFRQFHADRYHPGQGLFYLYGDIPTGDQLRFLAPVLNEFSPPSSCIPPHSSLPRQPRWTAPRRVERDYPIGTGEDAASRSFFTLNWIVGDAFDPATVTAWEVLSRLLLGNEAAPLKKAIVDSKLGANVFFAGTWASGHEQEFHVGLKGTETDRAEAFQKLVLDTLTTLAGQPFTRDQVAAAFQQLAYDVLEVKTLFPMHLLEAVNTSWAHGGDPLTFLRMREHLDACRQRWERDPGLFHRLIRENLLENPHRLLVVLRPDREVQVQADAATATKLAAQRAQLTADQIAGIAKAAAALEAAQGVPNSPDALAKLPQLRVADLPAQPRHIPTTVSRAGAFTVLRNDVFANSVNYFEFDCDLAGLPVELYPWLPRFTETFNQLGAAGQPFTTIAERRAGCTGGLWCGSGAWLPATGGVPLRRVRFGLKTLDGQAAAALQLLGDLLFGADPRDRDRLRDVLTQTRAELRTALINDGLNTARRHAARGLSPVTALEQFAVSPAALREMEDLTGRFDQRAAEVMERVLQVRDGLLQPHRWTVSFTGSDKVFDQLGQRLNEWSARMRPAKPADALPVFTPFAEPPREGLAGPMQVAHCARAFPAPVLAAADSPLFALGLYLASFDYFLPEIRFKGNAYGAGIRYDDTQGIAYMFSFRDPHIVETLAVFDGLTDWVARQQWTQTDIDRAIIGSAKDAEKPIRPGEATGLALSRQVRGFTGALREQRYQATLAATPKSVKETLQRILAGNLSRAAVCVVSSREKLAAANATLGDRALSVTDILPRT